MSTATTQEVRRQNVQKALRKAHVLPTGNARTYGALDWLLDQSTPQMKASMLTIMELGMVNDHAWEYVRRRLQQEVEPLYERIGKPDGDPDSDMASLWLSV